MNRTAIMADPAADTRPPSTVTTIVITALALSYGGTLWLAWVHAGGALVRGTALLTAGHAVLALPFVLVAVAGAVLAAPRLLGPGRWLRSGAAAVAGSGGLAVAQLVRGLLDPSPGGGDPVRAAVPDAVVTVPVALVIAVLVASVLAYRPRVEVQPGRPRGRRRLAIGVVGVASILPLLGSQGIAAADVRSAAATAPASVCPVGAPVKHFDVQAIDVDITLNRFGDHDPFGHMYVLAGQVAAVRAQEASRTVTPGLREDPIQPLVIRANEGDCVDIAFTNNATGGSYGVHIDGLAFATTSSGDAVGRNAASSVARGASATYRYFVPADPTLEGTHYLHPGPGNREVVSHGLFGGLVVEPPGSTYTDLEQGRPQQSGFAANIVPAGAAPFREYVIAYHEVGNEKFDVFRKDGSRFPRVDPLSDSYRPGGRALNYRTEPFMNRLERSPEGESLGYSSYIFGDPATPNPRSYQADPTKMRILHAGSEVFHVHHLHGGGIRWRADPKADPTFDYAATGLDKHPKTVASPSERTDSQAIGPGEAYNLEIEGGAGGVQQGAGEFLFHCHIAEHYVSGMWSFWRVYDTAQPDLVPLPQRVAPPAPVTSDQLIGKTFGATTLTAANIDSWVRAQVPPQGVPQNVQDATVWNYAVDRSAPAGPVYLGEPEDTRPFANLVAGVSGHPGSYAGDTFVGNRPKILFNPANGRYAWPLFRPHIGQRPPFSPNGHSGAPWLGENQNAAPAAATDPFAGRSDGLCPTGSTLRTFNIVAIQVPVQVTAKGSTDPNGMIYVLAKDKDDILAGRKPATPLAIRSNIGDCVAVTLTNEQTDAQQASGFAKVNIHIHHVQFDTQASDGVISGLSYEQSVRPYKAEDPALTAAAATGDTVLHLASVAKFRPGVFLAAGLGTESIEPHQVAAVDAAAGTVTLTTPLRAAHPAGQFAGVEFVQYRWYPDVNLDNVFWHDHVDGIHNWGHGLVGQIVVEPKGSTYHDPKSGNQVDSGAIVDIHTPNVASQGLVEGSFREFAAWEINENPQTDSTINLRSEPFSDRGGDPSLRFSSVTHGDPFTPLPRAYAGDPLIVRLINVSQNVDTFHIDGHKVYTEGRLLDAAGKPAASPVDTVHIGISERFSLALEGGAGGPNHVPGDYLYNNGVGKRFVQGAWGIIRVLGNRTPDLQPLPDRTAPPAGPGLPAVTGGRPAEPASPGNPCTPGAPVHDVAVSAVDVPSSGSGGSGSGVSGGSAVRAAFVPSAQAAAVRSGQVAPQPLVLHVAAGECVRVTLHNERSGARASFHVGGPLQHDTASSGIDVGFNPEQTVAPGGTRTYVYFADSAKAQSVLVNDFGGDDTGTIGLYGSIVVAPAGATFTDPVGGARTDVGTAVDVHVPGTPGYRDFTSLIADNDPIIGGSFMPYNPTVNGAALLNYRSAPRPNDTGGAFAGDPPTPVLTSYAGDPVKVHVLVVPGSDQLHVFGLGGLSFPVDPAIPLAETKQQRGIGPFEKLDAEIVGGAGGQAHVVGDFFYGDLRRPFTQAGIWGLQRVLSDPSCPIRPLDGRTCAGG